MLCIQEHWYFSYEKNDLINISSTHETQAKSVDDYTEKQTFIHERGYGGVAIFWRKDIDHAIKSHDDGNERINVITVNMKEHPLCIINVYMPSDNSNRDEQYKVILSQLEEIIDKFQCQYQILLCGDFNASLHRDNRPRDECLQQFMESNGMKLVNGYPTKFTFYHHNQKSTSQIDYIMHKSKEKAMEYRVKILDLEPLNVSDHTLVIADMSGTVTKKKRNENVIIKIPD